MPSGHQTTVGTSASTGTQTGAYGGTAAQSFTNPLVQQFQNQLGRQIGGALQTAQQPLYGSAQVAQVLNNLNNLGNASIANLRSNLARTGGLQGGQLGQGITDIDIAKMGQASGFASQLPLMNRQAMLQSMTQLGGLGNQFLSVAPKTQTTAGTQTGMQQQTGTSQQTTSLPWYSGLQGALGPIASIGGALTGMPFMQNLMGGGGGGTPTFAPPSPYTSSAFAPPSVNTSIGGGSFLPGYDPFSSLLAPQAPPYMGGGG